MILAGVLAGVALRVWFLVGQPGAIDSDEAIVGLMARHALYHGELSAFFWGQAYGGSLEALLAVPLFAMFGATPLVLKAVPMLLSAVAATLVWRLGRRTVGERPGAVAAVAVWVWPASLVWFSTKEKGFYGVCLVLGLAFLLVVLRLVEEPRHRWWWFLLGLLGGIGWWTSPQFLYFALPGLAWIFFRLRGEAWRLVLAAPAAVVGAAPWIAFNLRNGWSSLEATSHLYDEGVLGNAWVLLHEGIPVILGLKIATGWLLDPVFPVLYVALLVAVAVGVARHRKGTGLLALGVLLFVPVYANFPVSGMVGEGRYLLFLLPFLALLLAHAARRPVAQGAFLAAALALSVVTVPMMSVSTAPLAGDREVPDDLDPLLHALDRRGVTHLFADYWIAYRVDFESSERIIASPFGATRYAPYDRAVMESSAPAWVFVEGASLAQQFEIELARREVAFSRFSVGGFVVYQPEERVVCWPPPPAPGVACS